MKGWVQHIHFTLTLGTLYWPFRTRIGRRKKLICNKLKENKVIYIYRQDTFVFIVVLDSSRHTGLEELFRLTQRFTRTNLLRIVLGGRQRNRKWEDGRRRVGLWCKRDLSFLYFLGNRSIWDNDVRLWPTMDTSTVWLTTIMGAKCLLFWSGSLQFVK